MSLFFMRSSLLMPVFTCLLALPVFASPAPMREVPGYNVYGGMQPQPAARAVAPAPAQAYSHQYMGVSTNQPVRPLQRGAVCVPAAIPHQPVYYVVPQKTAKAVHQTVVYQASQPILVESAIRPYAALTPRMLSDNYKYLTLSNGSEWRVRHRDRPRVKHWHNGDLLSIELGSVFSRFQYKLINHSRLESAEVNRL